MRPALLLLGGLTLLGSGIAVLALGLPGATVLGPGLIIAGLLVKTTGFLLTDERPLPPPRGSGRTVTTLGADRARVGTSTGRASALHSARAARSARTARAQAHAIAARRPRSGRRAS